MKNRPLGSQKKDLMTRTLRPAGHESCVQTGETEPIKKTVD